jgi:hypothetical protein
MRQQMRRSLLLGVFLEVRLSILGYKPQIGLGIRDFANQNRTLPQ